MVKFGVEVRRLDEILCAARNGFGTGVEWAACVARVEEDEVRISLRMFAKVSCSLLVALIFLFARPLGAQHTSPAADAQKPPLLSAAEVGALDQELSGETAKRNLEGIVRFHRVRGSRGFHDAAELVAERARAYGLSDVQILEFPADGKIFYGTQRSRPPWDADFAELWEMGELDGKWSPAVRLASWDAMPVTLAEDSESADVTADLVDVGDGTKESDYAGKDVRGKIVLAAAQPGSSATSGGGSSWSGGNCQLCVKSAAGLAGRGRKFNSLGTFGKFCAGEDVCVYGVD